jgi:hypothetical protein
MAVRLRRSFDTVTSGTSLSKDVEPVVRDAQNLRDFYHRAKEAGE